ncbi:MAG: hypothetical protein IKS40_09130 [Treponema sp.]|nr:hypothetical protein [Treponema sp.]
MKKSILIFLFLAFLSSAFAQSSKVIKNENRDWVFDTSFPELMDNGIDEEIQIFNNSCEPLLYVTCKIVINGKEHKMRTISKLEPGDTEEFDGYEDEEIGEEIPKFFGADGRFSRKNTNKIRFIISFKDHKNDVVISKVLMNDSHLIFTVDDSPDRNVKSEQDALEDAGAQVVTIDGKKFLLYGGKAYPVE